MPWARASAPSPGEHLHDAQPERGQRGLRRRRQLPDHLAQRSPGRQRPRRVRPALRRPASAPPACRPHGQRRPGAGGDGGVLPSWGNGTGAQPFTGALTEPEGPAGESSIIVGAATTTCRGASGQGEPLLTVEAPNRAPVPACIGTGRWSETISPAVQGQEKTWRLHVGDSFTDVPRPGRFYRFVETILHHGVTGGCAATAYCPAGSHDAGPDGGFRARGAEGAGYVAAACGATPMFADVPATSPFCRWVEELARRGVVGGCGGGNYCPSAPVTPRADGGFRAAHAGPGPQPARLRAHRCSPTYPRPAPSAAGSRSWCGAASSPVAAAGTTAPPPRHPRQMAVFLTATFGLALYGP